MDPSESNPTLVPHLRHLPWLIVLLTLLVLAGVILFTTLQLRERTRAQISNRDGEVLHAVALMHANEPELELFGTMEAVENQQTVILKTSRLKGVLATRLFDLQGQVSFSFPNGVTGRPLPAAELGQLLLHRRALSHFRPAVAPSEIFVRERPDPRQAWPVLEVNVPLHAAEGAAPVAIGQFILEGHSIAGEFAQLDRNLAWQALAAFTLAGSLLVTAISWAFRRLRRSNALLEQRTRHLIKANQELALAAKTSALGAVTAHLLHGLKSPLSGLQNFVTTLNGTDQRPVTEGYDQAVHSTRRMQAMIHQVVNILREDETGSSYEVTLAELLASLQFELGPSAQHAGVELKFAVHTSTAWPSRAANLISLILANLIQNAIEASARGQKVTLTIQARDRQVCFEVADEGFGFPGHLSPFSPCQSSKEGGSGIGLALSKQLANHLAAALELKPNTPRGCRLLLALPLPMDPAFAQKSERAAPTFFR